MQRDHDVSGKDAKDSTADLPNDLDETDTFHDAVEAGESSHPGATPNVTGDGASQPASTDTPSSGPEPSDVAKHEIAETVEKDEKSPSESRAPGSDPVEGDKDGDGKKALSIRPDTQTPSANDESAIYSPKSPKSPQASTFSRPNHVRSSSGRKSDGGQSKPAVSEWSHQQLAPQVEHEEQEISEEEWKSMPAFAQHTIYDDDTGKIIAEELPDDLDEFMGYGKAGGASKGYTRVQVDEDAQSATSLDENTAYLFTESKGASHGIYEDDEEMRDALAQMQATKTILTEGQRIAYVGVVRLAMVEMLATLQGMERTRGAKKEISFASEAMILWSQKMMVRLYGHMDVDTAEQVMIEQLADHGLQPGDLTPTLMANARVKNPNFDEDLAKETSGTEANDTFDTEAKEPSNSETKDVSVTEGDNGAGNAGDVESSNETSQKSGTDAKSEDNDKDDNTKNISSDEQTAKSDSSSEEKPIKTTTDEESSDIESKEQMTAKDQQLTDGSAAKSSSDRASMESTAPPPPYSEDPEDQLKGVKSFAELPQTRDLDIDIRWTVLCDLFLVLISDSNYDARSRVLLEHVGDFLKVPWLDICRFEKRITDALEMEEEVNQETWDEQAHMENRRKQARKRRLMMMGLATVGGSLVIGLSAGLLAPVIGAGLAAGFTTIGVGGTSGFLAGAGGAALVTTTGVVTGGTIGVRSANRRTGVVKTFEYRPLHNNKRVNLIVTIAGWMTGKIDDVRLPFSTIDPIMGDIYSVHWEPEMLRSMGETINILATEALTQGLQQILGSTILIGLMAALQLPVLLTKLSYLIDNPWAVSLARADQAGLILADSLIERNLGLRPITLVGFSIGCRVIFSALKEMSKKGAIGVVQNVYLFGSPIVIKKDEYLRAKTIVSGRFVNGYATNDWILGYLFRVTGGGIMPVAGLAKVDIPGMENIDVTEDVPGHMAYRAAMPKLMRKVGWSVESDDFTEIEEPDPDNLEKRQRELINEIEEARKELEQKPEKKRFGIFGRSNKKKLEKKAWETYDDRMKGGVEDEVDANADETPGGLLFDVDAIRAEAAELAAQGFQVKQLETTMPALKLDTNSPYLSNGEFTTRSAPTLLPRKSHDRQTSPSPSPSPSPSRSARYGGHENREPSPLRQDDRISMSFEHSAQPSVHAPSIKESEVSSRDPSPEPSERPKLTTAHSTPAPEVNFDRNVWADEDEFGKEKELEMTFE